VISKLRFSMDGSLRMGPFWKGQLEKQVEILNRKCREISVEKLRGECGFSFLSSLFKCRSYIPEDGGALKFHLFFKVRWMIRPAPSDAIPVPLWYGPIACQRI